MNLIRDSQEREFWYIILVNGESKREVLGASWCQVLGFLLLLKDSSDFVKYSKLFDCLKYYSKEIYKKNKTYNLSHLRPEVILK